MSIQFETENDLFPSTIKMKKEYEEESYRKFMTQFKKLYYKVENKPLKNRKKIFNNKKVINFLKSLEKINDADVLKRSFSGLLFGEGIYTFCAHAKLISVCMNLNEMIFCFKVADTSVKTSVGIKSYNIKLIHKALYSNPHLTEDFYLQSDSIAGFPAQYTMQMLEKFPHRLNYLDEIIIEGKFRPEMLKKYPNLDWDLTIFFQKLKTCRYYRDNIRDFIDVISSLSNVEDKIYPLEDFVDNLTLDFEDVLYLWNKMPWLVDAGLFQKCMDLPLEFVTSHPEMEWKPEIIRFAKTSKGMFLENTKINLDVDSFHLTFKRFNPVLKSSLTPMLFERQRKLIRRDFANEYHLKSIVEVCF